MTAPPRPLVRTLRDIAADALLADCGWCWGGWGNPCTTDEPGGMHVARLNRAYRRGLISEADYMAVIHSLDAFTSATVVTRETAGAAA